MSASCPTLAGRLLPGHDFVNDDDDATDDNGHGTMTADLIAAAGDNRTGIAGICWKCRILPVKVLGATGSGSYTDIARGIRYAADRHATIITCRWAAPTTASCCATPWRTPSAEGRW